MSFVRLLLYLFLAGCGLGCQVPRYQLPGGFSSTYYRQLHGDYLSTSLEETLEVSESQTSPGVFYPQTFRFDPPTRSEFQQAVRLPENRPPRPRRY